MVPLIYNPSMTKQDLYLEALVRAPQICDYWGIPRVAHLYDMGHPRYDSMRVSGGGAHFGLYKDSPPSIWVNVKDSSAPVKVKGRAWSYPGNKTDRTASGILFHELGHHIQASIKMDACMWRLIVDKYKKEAVSGYEPTYDESFAETLRLFSSNPDLLRLACPRRYDFVRQYLTPWHEATWREILANAPAFLVDNAARWAGV